MRTCGARQTWLGAPEFWTWGLLDRSRGGSLKPIHGFPTVYYTFLSNVHRAGVQDVIAPLPISSLQGAQVLAHYGCQADAIYIDGSHEYDAVSKQSTRSQYDAVLAELRAPAPITHPPTMHTLSARYTWYTNQVLADLCAYWPLLRPAGGVCFGDDYCAEWPGVKAAVDEFAALHDLELEVHGIVWFVTKPAARVVAAATAVGETPAAVTLVSVEATTATEVVVRPGQLGR